MSDNLSESAIAASTDQHWDTVEAVTEYTMFEDALRYPWNGENKLETLLIGGLLVLLGVFLIPILFVYGYLIRVVRQTAVGNAVEPPAFSDWGDLLVDGVVGFVISLVYFLVPAIVVSVGTLLFVVPVTVVGSGAGDGSGGFFAAGGVLVGLTVVALSLLLTVAAAYLLPAAVAAFARTGRFGAAFSVSTLRPIVTDKQYATAWVVAVAVTLLAQILGGAVSATGIGVVLVPFISFYGNVSGAYAIGRGVSNLDFESATEDDAAASQPAV